jgi:hypothetical protein
MELLKRVEHIEFAKFAAWLTYIQETERLDIQRDRSTDFLADKACNWIGKHIGTLPDSLEPGIEKHHRKIFHSEDAFRKIEEWKEQIRSRSSKNWYADVFLLMALSAYQSHIVLDSTTPMGAPDYKWVWDFLELFKSR